MAHGLADLLDACRDDLLARWLRAVRRHYAPDGLSVPELKDHIPGFLDELSKELRRGRAPRSHEEPNGSAVAEMGAEHGRQRFHVGFDVAAVVREYGELREVIFDVIREAAFQPTLDEVDTLVRSVSSGVAEAVASYAQLREVELRHAKEELERTAEFRERFLGVVSHDLRSPIQAIAYGATLLMRSKELPEVGLRAASRIATSAQRMSKLVSDLLDFTRGRIGGGIPIQRSSENLFKLTQQAIEEVELAHPMAAVHVDARGDADGCWDAGRIVQLVANLVNNAVQYGAEGGAVTVCVRGDESDVSVAVHNGGPAIPAALIPTLFEPFRRGALPRSTERASGGLGLGLFIVHEIALAHSGDVTVESSDAAGTTFTVRLPRAATKESAESAAPAP